MHATRDRVKDNGLAPDLATELETTLNTSWRLSEPYEMATAINRVMDVLRLRERGTAAMRKIRLRLTQPLSWKLPKQPSSIAPLDVWTNADMDPVPLERRTWGKGAFVTYWVSDLVTISTWSSGSAVVTLGTLEPTTGYQGRLLNYRRRPLSYRRCTHYPGSCFLQCRADRLQWCYWC
jgi:hypothetical protein